MKERFSGSSVYDVLCAAGDEEKIVLCRLPAISRQSEPITYFMSSWLDNKKREPWHNREIMMLTVEDLRPDKPTVRSNKFLTLSHGSLLE